MMKKVCIISLYTVGAILVAFPDKTISLQCFKCIGTDKEPYEDTTCSNVQNCTEAENSCMIHVTQYTETLEASNFELTCRYKVDCENLGLGCKKSKPDSQFTFCTACCESDRCNSPTLFKAPSTTPPTSGQSQIFPLTSILITLAVSQYWITP